MKAWQTTNGRESYRLFSLGLELHINSSQDKIMSQLSALLLVLHPPILSFRFLRHSIHFSVCFMSAKPSRQAHTACTRRQKLQSTMTFSPRLTPSHYTSINPSTSQPTLRSGWHWIQRARGFSYDWAWNDFAAVAPALNNKKWDRQKATEDGHEMWW